jgi:hypothetical protein
MNHSNHKADDIKKHSQEKTIFVRFYERYQWMNYWGDHCFKYLLFVNAGGIIAVLTFMGTFDDIRPISFALAGLSLVCFIAGLVLVGFLSKHLFYFFKVRWQALKDDINQGLEYEEIIKRDDPRLEESRYGEKMALTASWLAFGGIVLGLTSFFTKEVLMMPISTKAILIILSGASYLAGTILLALAIEFRHEKMKGDKSPAVQAANVIGSPGIRNMTKHILGMILSALGYVLLLASLVL